ncbi:MAG: glycosyltransferase family 2 protein [Opitutae bacterium]|nr:glycosyltransferase family 2 protein [Opitutae bacterium]
MRESKIEVSLVLTAYNCLHHTQRTLNSLQDIRVGSELIVIDDASNDGTREFLNELDFPRIRIVHNPVNIGYASSANLGASMTTGEFICFLNNDLVLTNAWLGPMLHGLQSLSDAGIVGCVQRNPTTDLVDHAGMFFDLKGYPRHAGHKFRNVSKEIFTEWRAVTAACFVIRRDVFMAHGGFDTSYRNGFEDVDLCVRLGQNGLRHYVANQSQIYHHVSQSPGRKLHESRNAQIFLERWGNITRRYGLAQWPREYLRICRNRPRKFRPFKFGLALWLLLMYGEKCSNRATSV